MGREILYVLRHFEALRAGEAKCGGCGCLAGWTVAYPFHSPGASPFLRGAVLGVSAFEDSDISGLFLG